MLRRSTWLAASAGLPPAQARRAIRHVSLQQGRQYALPRFEPLHARMLSATPVQPTDDERPRCRDTVGPVVRQPPALALLAQAQLLHPPTPLLHRGLSTKPQPAGATDEDLAEPAATRQSASVASTTAPSAPKASTTSTSKPAHQTSAAKRSMATEAIVMTGDAIKLTATFLMAVARDPRGKGSELWSALKHMAKHYWVGSKLLWADVQIASTLLSRLVIGHTLTRREHRQLVRTTTDIFRLVPFSIFVIVPFMEFLLPVALRLFPNMLPSTFEDKYKREEDMKRLLKMRVNMAGFMKDMLREMAKDVRTTEGDDGQGGSAKELADFVEKARLGIVANQDIIKFSRLFRDDLTLDNISRTQLVTMCKFMHISPYGADAFLRFQLRMKVRDLRNDDRRIAWEGVNELSRAELQEACTERGMRGLGLSKEALRRQLQHWIELSCERHVPISLLVLSRSFSLASGDVEFHPEKVLVDSISSLDEDVVNEAIIEAATPEERKTAEIKTLRLEALQHQSDLIKDEREDFEESKEAVKEKKEAKANKKVEVKADPDATEVDQALQDVGATMTDPESAEPGTAAAQPKPAPSTAAGAPVAEAEDGGTDTQAAEDEEDEQEAPEEDLDITVEEIEALADYASQSAVSREKGDVANIKKAVESLELHKLTADTPSAEDPDPADVPPELPEDAAAQVHRAMADVHDELPEHTAAKVQATVAAEETPVAAATPEASATEERVDPAPPAEMPEDRAVAAVKSKLVSMLDKLEADLATVDDAIGEKMRILDLDGDGLLSPEELTQVMQTMMRTKLTKEQAAAKVEVIMKEVDSDLDGMISVDEMREWVNKEIKKREVEVHEDRGKLDKDDQAKEASKHSKKALYE